MGAVCVPTRDGARALTHDRNQPIHDTPVQLHGGVVVLVGSAYGYGTGYGDGVGVPVPGSGYAVMVRTAAIVAVRASAVLVLRA